VIVLMSLAWNLDHAPRSAARRRSRSTAGEVAVAAGSVGAAGAGAWDEGPQAEGAQTASEAANNRSRERMQG
jgi:hypothetical protein